MVTRNSRFPTPLAIRLSFHLRRLSFYFYSIEMNTRARVLSKLDLGSQEVDINASTML